MSYTRRIMYTCLRTLEANFPFLMAPKLHIQRLYRNKLSIPHENDFRAISFLPEIPDSLYVDIGANHGQSIDAILMMNRTCRVKSFEPNHLLYTKLVDQFQWNSRVEIYNYALGNETGEFTLYI